MTGVKVSLEANAEPLCLKQKQKQNSYQVEAAGCIIARISKRDPKRERRDSISRQPPSLPLSFFLFSLSRCKCSQFLSPYLNMFIGQDVRMGEEGESKPRDDMIIL